MNYDLKIEEDIQAYLRKRKPLLHLASIGKPMTATATMMLVEAGRISLDDTVASILPAYAGDGRDARVRSPRLRGHGLAPLTHRGATKRPHR